MLLVLDFKPPIHPPLVGVLDPTSGTRAKYSINYGFNHLGVEQSLNPGSAPGYQWEILEEILS